MKTKKQKTYLEYVDQCRPECAPGEERSYVTGLKTKDFGSLAFGTPIFYVEETLAEPVGKALGYFCGICPQGYVYYTPKPVKQEDFYKEYFSGQCTIEHKYWTTIFVSHKATLKYLVKTATVSLARVRRYAKDAKKSEAKLLKTVEKLKNKLRKEEKK